MILRPIRQLIFAAVSAAALMLPSVTASGADLPKTWKVNGNGYTGVLVISRIDASTNEVSGRLLGTPVKGYLVDRHIVLHRYPHNSTQIWDGWILDPALGAQGQPTYDGTLIIAGTLSESSGDVDGVYPWYAVAQEEPEPVAALIVNGSFEDGASGSNLTTGITGWTVVRDNVDVVAGWWQQVDGARSLDLAGDPGSGAIEQTFATTPGRTYDVTFAIAGNPVCESPKKTMRVSAAGQTADFTFDTTGTTLSTMSWQHRSWQFVANAQSTTLRFESTGPNRRCGIALDDIVVRPR